MCPESFYKSLIVLSMLVASAVFAAMRPDGCGADTFDSGFPWTSPLQREEEVRFESLRDFDWASKEPQTRAIDLRERVNDAFVETLFDETTEALGGASGIQLHWYRDSRLSVASFPDNWMVLGVPNRLAPVAELLRPVAKFAQFVAHTLNARIPNPRPLSNVHLLYLNSDRDQRLIEDPHVHNYEDYGVNIELMPRSKGIVLCGEGSAEKVSPPQQLTVFNSRTLHRSYPQRRRLLMILSFAAEQ
ncbi:MAG: hypothetical protein KDD51_05770 [Bdellovibrionales bacterium]|nr:hypothetical protein [Bdellovibrionales bacterium]